MLKHTIDYSDMKYKEVSGGSTCSSGGVVIPDGEKVAIARFIAGSGTPLVCIKLVWDHGGESEKIFMSTCGDIDLMFDVANAQYQIVGDGVKMLKIVISNGTTSTSPTVGGSFELTKLYS